MGIEYRDLGSLGLGLLILILLIVFNFIKMKDYFSGENNWILFNRI